MKKVTTTMNERINASKSKKGFTLVEIVIVIAILAILAGIAIPVITTTIKSARISAMESDAASLEILVKECMTTAEAGINTTKYGRNRVSASKANIEDICYSNKLDSSKFPVDGPEGKNFFNRTFGSVTYRMVFVDNKLYISGAEDVPSGNSIDITANTSMLTLINNI